MEAWEILSDRDKRVKQLEAKRKLMTEALQAKDYTAYKIHLCGCRNISAAINELTEQYNKALDKEVRGW